jgi:hypothetical protein
MQILTILAVITDLSMYIGKEDTQSNSFAYQGIMCWYVNFFTISLNMRAYRINVMYRHFLDGRCTQIESYKGEHSCPK